MLNEVPKAWKRVDVLTLDYYVPPQLNADCRMQNVEWPENGATLSE